MNRLRMPASHGRLFRRALLFQICALLLFTLNSRPEPSPLLRANEPPVLPGTAQELTEDVEGREDWFSLQRTYPNGSIPADARRLAWEGSGRGRLQALNAATAAPRWQSIGPLPTIAFYGGNWGLTSGRINTVAVSPSNPNTILIGSSTGGIWLSTNGGATFVPTTDNQADLAVGSIAFSKSNPSIVYAGMGDKALGYLGSGVLKSNDGGRTWQRVSNNSLPSPGTISKIEVDPTNPNRVYVAQYTRLSGERVVSSGFYFSNDGGVNWSRTFNGRLRDIAIDPVNRQTLYIGTIRIDETEGPHAGVYKSTNSGKDWTLLLETSYDNLSTRDIKVGVAPSDGQTIYAYMGGFAGGVFNARLMASNDGGANWTNRGNSGFDTGQFGYNTYIAVDPLDARKIYLGSRDLYRSTDGGNSWTNLTRNFTPSGSFYTYTPFFSNTHPDQHALAFAPANPNEIYIGNDGGVYRSTDGGNTFQSLNTSLSLTQFISIALHPTDPEISYGGTQDNGTQRRLASRAQWSEIATGDGGRCVINPLDPSMVFITYIRGHVFRFVNNGTGFDRQIAWSSTFQEPDSSPRIAFYPPLTGNGVDATLYFGSWRLFISDNDGQSWFPPGGETDLTKGISIRGTDVLTAIGVGRSDLNVIYTGSAQGRAMVSTDGGANWTDITSGLPDRFITSIKVDPDNSATAYLTLSGFGSGHVFKTTDTGATWTNISAGLPDIPVNDLLIDPINTSMLYVGTDIGVYRTAGDETGWREFNQGLPPVVVQAFAAQDSGLIQCATYGRGAFELTGDLRPIIVSAEFDGRKKITIKGSGFGDTPRVFINGTDRSSRIKNATGTEIKLKGKTIKLGLEPGANTIKITDSTGGASNTVVINF